MEEAIQHSNQVWERQGCKYPPLPVRVYALGTDRAGQPRQVLSGRLLQQDAMLYGRQGNEKKIILNLRQSNKDLLLRLYCLLDCET